jgi:hypothetical protein
MFDGCRPSAVDCRALKPHARPAFCPSSVKRRPNPGQAVGTRLDRSERSRPRMRGGRGGVQQRVKDSEPRVEQTSSASERQPRLHPPTRPIHPSRRQPHLLRSLGQKSRLFIGAAKVGQRGAILCTITEICCHRCSLDPLAMSATCSPSCPSCAYPATHVLLLRLTSEKRCLTIRLHARPLVDSGTQPYYNLPPVSVFCLVTTGSDHGRA